MSPPGGVRYRLLLGLARAALLWERLWRRLWPTVALVGLFVSIALLDVLPRLDPWAHALVLAAFAVALAWSVRAAVRGFRAADRSAARHRLERDSGLEHRPLTALEDTLAAGASDAVAVGLWRVHRERMARAARNLRLRLPSPGLAKRDPYGLRAAVFLFLVVALAAGRGDAAARLERALVPQFERSVSGPLAVEVWITPPAYTGKAPIFLEARGQGEMTAGRIPVRVPEGSAVLAQVNGVGSAPELKVGGRTGPFTEIGSGGYRAEGVVESGDTLVVREGRRELASWPLEVIPDLPPTAEFTAPPARTGTAHLRIDYEVGDDYGLKSVKLVIERPEGPPVANREAEIPLPLAGLGKKSAKGRSIQDMTSHPWAGLPVRVRLVAVDGKGQTGASEPIALILPERIFNHPVARALIELRKKLATPSYFVRAEVAAELDDIMRRPKHFFDDTVVFLALSVAQARLLLDQRPEAVTSVRRVLWNTALRIEDGELTIAEQDLVRIQEELMQALRDRADNAELERRMDDLQRALEKYLALLGKQLEKQGALKLPITPGMDVLRSDELRRMIEEARELARTGALAAARRMLAELQRRLDSLRAGVAGGQNNEAVKRLRRLMQGLTGLTQQQRQLLDRTFRRFQLQRPGGAEGGETRPSRKGEAEQKKLRRRLGDLMLQTDEALGRIPKDLGSAERAMRDAAKALGQGDLGGAVPAQTRALESLRQAMEGVAEQVARRLGGLQGNFGEGQRSGPGRDPFGRVPGGAYGTAVDGDVKVPDQMEMRRVRQILDELRRRAGERRRPKLERDYINRLLKQF